MSSRQSRANQDMEMGTVPLQTQESYWRKVFDKYDKDKDGRISYEELRTIIGSREYGNEIPEVVVRKMMTFGDQDNSGYLEFPEFIDMVENPQIENYFNHLVARYVYNVVPRRRVPTGDALDGYYEEQYSCCPPPVFMILISAVEIALFLADVMISGYYSTDGSIATALIYNPYKRYEAYRFISYMFVHIGAEHLTVNVIVQFMLGIPLEMVHRWWRVAIIYFAGVLCGSLGTSVTDPNVFLAGASGGVYALLTAHIATIIMNWAQMNRRIRWLQVVIFVVIIIVDLGLAIYNRYIIQAEENIGYAAHLFGAFVGLLVGINILRNFQVTAWEKKLWWISLVTFVTLMAVLIVWNVVFPNYFPPQR